MKVRETKLSPTTALELLLGSVHRRGTAPSTAPALTAKLAGPSRCVRSARRKAVTRLAQLI